MDRLFSNLTDEQLQALRQLASAGLAANPALACGEGLALVAEADREQQARDTLTRPALTPLGVPTVAPAALGAALGDAAAGVRPQVTSTTKWSPVAGLLAGALGLSNDAVYVTSVGGLRSRNITVRLVQSRRARQATVAAVIWTVGVEPLQQALNSASRACLDNPRVTLVFTTDEARFDLAAIITPPAVPAPPQLTAAYPQAILLGGCTHRLYVGRARLSRDLTASFGRGRSIAKPLGNAATPTRSPLPQNSPNNFVLSHITKAHACFVALQEGVRGGNESDPFAGLYPMIELTNRGADHLVELMSLVGPGNHPNPHLGFPEPNLSERLGEITGAVDRAREAMHGVISTSAGGDEVSDVVGDLDHIEGVVGEILTMLDGR